MAAVIYTGKFGSLSVSSYLLELEAIYQICA